VSTKKSRTSRRNRHRITLAALLNQNLRRLADAASLAQQKAKEHGIYHSAPIAPNLAGPEEWNRHVVELVTAEQIAQELRADRSTVARLLQKRHILPIYYDGKVPLYSPAIARKLHEPMQYPVADFPIGPTPQPHQLSPNSLPPQLGVR